MVIDKLEISSTPVKNEISGLSKNALRYFDKKSNETFCYITINEGQVCLYSNKLVPLNVISFILQDCKKHFDLSK